MEVMRVLRMNKGDDENSYAKNSKVQSKMISLGKRINEEAIMQMLCTNIPDIMGIADLGCSSGPNSLSLISEIIDMIYAKCRDLGRPTPELKVFLNDLPCNDFNSIFGSLPAFYDELRKEKGSEFGPCFVSATPGSFYGRLFPSRSLHCVHSSSSLHWLSQVPPGLESSARRRTTTMNKGKIYISKSSSHGVLEAYSLQFQTDFSSFLKSRSKEIAAGGCMLLSLMGRRSPDPTTDDSCYHWELLAQALMSMVSEGLVEEEKVDSFNAPYYGPCVEEIKTEIEKEGSFIVSRLETFQIEWDGGVDDAGTTFGAQSRGQRVAKTIRAVVESMLEFHFGKDIMDELFKRYGETVEDYLSKTGTKYTNLVISMVRKG
ncbi:JASMONATE O-METHYLTRANSFERASE-LIKE [Salix viminalis]|uniref:JASMONATE O-METHYLTRANSFERASE-LIKE n=1 Tax=Salix viminalis TaxID=40686 RepID=A0A9Q0UUL3_SALVM|nr:JASMONATE O-METHYLTRANSFERASE-LIKE [Salix viminalis]